MTAHEGCDAFHPAQQALGGSVVGTILWTGRGNDGVKKPWCRATEL